MRTVLSEEQVARRGRVGCGAVSQAREGEEGSRVARCDIRGRGEEGGIVEDSQIVSRSLGGKRETKISTHSPIHEHVVTLDGSI